MDDWRCECGDLNRHHEAGCYRCGAGRPDTVRAALDDVMQRRGVEGKVGFYGALLDELAAAVEMTAMQRTEAPDA